MFEIDDMAVCTLTDGLVKIKSDVFTAAGSGMKSYLVEWTEGFDEGKRSIVQVDDLEPAPKFKVGHEVSFAGVAHTVVAGPFNSGAGDWYVLESKDGHTTCTEDHMTQWSE